MSREHTISRELMLNVFFITLIFSFFTTAASAQTQRVSCSSDNFSIMAPPIGWELILNQDDILVFQNSTKETVMTFKKMPNTFPDLDTFIEDYKSNVEANEKVVTVPQGIEIIYGAEASNIKLEFKEPNELAPGTEGQVYLLLINKNAYFFEVFGLHVQSEYSSLFSKMVKSFKLNKASNNSLQRTDK